MGHLLLLAHISQHGRKFMIQQVLNILVGAAIIYLDVAPTGGQGVGTEAISPLYTSPQVGFHGLPPGWGGVALRGRGNSLTPPVMQKRGLTKCPRL